MNWTGITKTQEDALATARSCGICGVTRNDQAWQYGNTMFVSARPRHYRMLTLRGSSGWEASFGPDGVTMRCPEHTPTAYIERKRKEATP